MMSSIADTLKYLTDVGTGLHSKVQIEVTFAAMKSHILLIPIPILIIPKMLGTLAFLRFWLLSFK